ncbi:Hypothetical protein A7982_05609 [Minicystis rosea]|nr:Hypothetical protein A7982_05609 [Minicystis rosea]
MRTLLLWCILFVISAPLAVAALILYPVVWLLLLPFRVLGVAVDGVLALLRAVLWLPARALGFTPRRALS